MLTAYEAGFAAGRRLYEEEWVSLELFAGTLRGLGGAWPATTKAVAAPTAAGAPWLAPV